MVNDIGKNRSTDHRRRHCLCSIQMAIGKPRVDYLRDSVWEVRSKIGNRIARVLFAVEQSEIILLHAFVKKTLQTNPRDIELATKRLKEWKNGQNI